MPITKHDNLFRYIETRFTRNYCRDCGARTLDGEHNANHMYAQEIRISHAEWDKLKAFFRLWENNWECPNCGKPLGSPELATIRATETGLTYCSTDCAKEHVNKVWPEILSEQNTNEVKQQ